jgi:hypothetical protein
VTLSEIIAIFKTGKDLGAPLIQKLREQQLSDQERELLIAASADGLFHALDAAQLPAFLIMVGGQQFPARTDDLAEFAVYHEAFASLGRRGLVEHVDGILFRLTASGFDKARYLATHP